MEGGGWRYLLFLHSVPGEHQDTMHTDRTSMVALPRLAAGWPFGNPTFQQVIRTREKG